jgi:hypothetical protein
MSVFDESLEDFEDSNSSLNLIYEENIKQLTKSAFNTSKKRNTENIATN